MTPVTINGQAIRRRPARRHSPALGPPRRAGAHRHQVRMRHGALRRLHRAPRRPGRCASCMTPLSAVANKKVTTIEAIGADKVGKAVQTAWIDVSVPQCGYCQAGQIMSATALLKRKPEAHRCRHRQRHGRQHLPVRHLHPHSRRNQAGGGPAGSEVMIATPGQTSDARARQQSADRDRS